MIFNSLKNHKNVPLKNNGRVSPLADPARIAALETMQ